MQSRFGQTLSTLAFFSLTLTVACSTAPKTTLVPRDNGTFYAISTSRNESKALQSAVDEGTKFCQNKGKDFAVTDPRPDLKDIDPKVKRAGDVADVVLGRVLGNKARVEQMKNQAYTRDGDQLVMNFKCI